MTLYLLEWDNGEQWDDHECTLLGIYTNAKARDQAASHYAQPVFKQQWPFSGDKGFFVESELKADHELVDLHTSLCSPSVRNRTARPPTAS